MTRLLVLTGSPSRASLEWLEEHLENSLLPAFGGKQSPSAASLVTQALPAWRSLPLKAAHLPTGMTQASQPDPSIDNPCRPIVGDVNTEPAAGDSTVESGALEDSGDLESQSPVLQSAVTSQYYEHSFIVHEELQSSQIIGTASTEGQSASTAAETEAFESFESPDLDTHPQKQSVYARLCSGKLVDLKETPDALYLRSIVPQTMTVNLVVGIISISQPRRIIPRYNGRPVELLEILVGDETRSAFAINIWIPPAEAHRNRENYNLRNDVCQLRPRDIILARHVALNSFDNKVFGQSLRGDVTSLDLLLRKTVDIDDSPGVFRAKDLDSEFEKADPMSKVKRVRDWLVEFVGGSVTSKAKNSSFHSKRAALPALPLDTP